MTTFYTFLFLPLDSMEMCHILCDMAEDKAVEAILISHNHWNGFVLVNMYEKWARIENFA